MIANACGAPVRLVSPGRPLLMLADGYNGKEADLVRLWLDILDDRFGTGELLELYDDDTRLVVVEHPLGEFAPHTIDYFATQFKFSGDEGTPAFIPAKLFGGRKKLYTFGTGIYGTGYYRDRYNALPAQSASASAPGGTQNRRPVFPKPRPKQANGATPAGTKHATIPVEVGMRVSAEFPEDDPPIIHGVVGAVSAAGRQIFVAYDDGDSGWADFPDEGLEVLGYAKGFVDTLNSATHQVSQPVTRLSMPKARRALAPPHITTRAVHLHGTALCARPAPPPWNRLPDCLTVLRSPKPCACAPAPALLPGLSVCHTPRRRKSTKRRRSCGCATSTKPPRRKCTGRHGPS